MANAILFFHAPHKGTRVGAMLHPTMIPINGNPSSNYDNKDKVENGVWQAPAIITTTEGSRVSTTTPSDNNSGVGVSDKLARLYNAYNYLLVFDVLINSLTI